MSRFVETTVKMLRRYFYLRKRNQCFLKSVKISLLLCWPDGKSSSLGGFVSLKDVCGQQLSAGKQVHKHVPFSHTTKEQLQKTFKDGLNFGNVLI